MQMITDEVDGKNIQKWTTLQWKYEKKQEEVKSLERTQSHIFIFFDEVPYISLGWEKYRIVNNGIDLLLKNFQENYGVEVLFHEKPIFLKSIENFELFLNYSCSGVNIDNEIPQTNFFWCFSFFHSDTELLKKITMELIEEFNEKIQEYLKEKSFYILNNHDPEFDTDYPYYKSLLAFGEEKLIPQLNFEPQRNYEEQIFDQEIFLKPLPINQVLERFEEYWIDLHNQYLFKLDPSGFHSNKAKKDGSKFFREELMPIVSFLHYFYKNCDEKTTVYLGLKKEKYDFRLNLGSGILLGEVVSAYIPNDHLLISIALQMDYRNVMPAKNAHEYKQQKDSLVESILNAIQKKKEKKYNDERVLIVNFSVDYLYANSKSVFNEITREVQQKSELGTFQAIYLTCENLCNPIFELTTETQQL